MTYLSKVLLAALLGVTLVASAEEDKRLCIPNNDGGKVVITNAPCKFKIDWVKEKLHYAYATDKKHHIHDGCWFGEPGAIHIFYKEFLEDHMVANINPAIFSEEACNAGIN